LFADLEGQLDAASKAELDAEIADRTRRETAKLRLVDRLRPCRGYRVTVLVSGAGSVTGRVDDVGPDWVLLTESPPREALISTAAVLAISGLAARSAEPGSEGRVAARLGLGAALRRLARDRCGVSIVLVDGTCVAGTVDRAGADYVEVAEHPAGEPRRGSDVRGVRTVPISAVGIIRRA
jgi:hypothetical protein